MRGAFLAASCAFLGLVFASPGPVTAGEAPPDTLRRGTLLDRLQQADRAFYSDEIVYLDRSLADSGLAVLDSLGFEAFERETLKGAHRGALRFGFADRIGLYNRVEGGIAGLGMAWRLPIGPRPELTAQAGYASGPRKLRHSTSLRTPLAVSHGAPSLEVGYADRVVRLYSDDRGVNFLTSFYGSDAEESYLRRRGGWAALSWDRAPGGRWGLRYDAAVEDSVRRRTDFGLFATERPMSFNIPVDEGAERSIEATWSAGSLLSGRQEASLRHRVAGGGLGGDFVYSRLTAEASARRFLIWNHEAVLDLAYTRVGGWAPRQRLADLGGLGTVRGFAPRTQVGRESLRARVELLLPYDLFARARVPLLRRAGLQLVPWADAGRSWGACEDGSGGGSGCWLTSAGLGFQTLLGPFGAASFLRFDAAVPMGPERKDDLRLYLYFARGLF